MNKKTIEQRPRLVVVDMMVGIAMTLVVLGHNSFNFAPHWYNNGLHPWIYAFHMELFVFLSSLLIRHSYRGIDGFREYFQYIGRKFAKFFIPFLLVGTAVGLSSAYLNHNVELQGGWWSVLLNTLQQLFVWPMQSNASFLWYIYVLMGFYVISPLVFKLPRWTKMALCLASVALTVLPATYKFGLALFCKYGFFYFMGILCAEGIEELKTLKWWHALLGSLPFVAWTLYFILTKERLFSVFTGLIALPATAFLGMGLKEVKPLRWCLARISKGCYWIYLLQMFVSWGCAILYRETALINVVPFGGFLFVNTLLSIALPLCLQTFAESLQRGRPSAKD
ncbi:MAG: acyltransferase [Bacteroidales bacterium]|nr:acyltransferase [Bacteroidales bacterium]